LNACLELFGKFTGHTDVELGIGLKIWQEIFAPVALKLVGLMEKVRKFPKQRLLLKSVGLSFAQCKEFLGIVKRMLQILQSIIARPCQHVEFTHNSATWPPVVDNFLVILKSLVMDNLYSPYAIQQHLLLLDVLQVIIDLDLHQIQPLQLFDHSKELFSSLAFVEAPNLSSQAENNRNRYENIIQKK
jgi:hypothetical protein